MELLRDLEAQVGPDWEQLTGDLPAELQLLLTAGPALTGDRLLEEPSSSSQGRLLELLLLLLVRLGESAPLLLVVEDLHWADPSTRDLVAFMARNLRHCRVDMVGTYRQDDLHRGHPLRPLLAELSRAGVDLIDLGGLDRRELGALVAGILGSTPTGSLIEEVLARSEGNPFYAEELLAASQAGEMGLPVSLREVILTRLVQLPEPSQRLLGTMAAIGRQARYGLLEQIVGPSDVELDDALAAAMDGGVLVAVPPDRYRFRHALIQEAVGAELMPGRRRRLHRRIAEILAEHPELADGAGSNMAGELAYHWEAAGEPERSLAASMTAGRTAQTLAAPAEALAHYQRVLSLWDRIADPESLARADHSEVLMAAAGAAALTGAIRMALTLAGTAMSEDDGTADRVRQALIRERLGLFTWLTDDTESAMALYEQAASLLASEPPSSAKARVLAAHAQGCMLLLRPMEALRRCQEAIQVARAVGDPAAEGHATNTLGRALAQLGRVEDGIEHLRWALALAEQLGNPDDLLRAHFNLFWPLMAAGRPHEAIDLARAGIDAAARSRCMGSYGCDLQSNVVRALVDVGCLSEATAVLCDIEAADEGRSAIPFLRASARLGLALGDFPGAEKAIEAAVAKTTKGRRSTPRAGRGSREQGDPDPSEGWTGSTQYSAEDIWVLVDGAEVAAVGARIGEARQRIDQARQLHRERGSPLDRIQTAAMAVHIEAEATRRVSPHESVGASERAVTLLRDARDLAESVVRDDGEIPPGLAARLAVAEAEALAAVGKPDPNAWAAAIDRLDDVGLVLVAARARLGQAEALLASHGSRQDAARLVAQARTAAESAGAKPLLREADRLAARARLDVGAAQQRVPVGPTPADHYGLTARETEVLAYLAEGRTNRQIADALFISEKTASVHVSNLLRKLGVSTRVQAGAIAQLLEPQS
jgi:DNA-binding CsgD family transcriptional regulator/tetratricopeptide (TPR) repeat protein